MKVGVSICVRVKFPGPGTATTSGIHITTTRKYRKEKEKVALPRVILVTLSGYLLTPLIFLSLRGLFRELLTRLATSLLFLLLLTLGFVP